MKLHPLSIPYRIVSRLGQISILYLFFLAPSIGGGSDSGLGYIFIIAILIAVISIIAVSTWEIAYYNRFRYNKTSNSLDITSGVLSRQKREIPLKRIQNVDIRQNIIHRLLDIAEINIETAGGSTSEAHLRYIAKEEAEEIQRWVRTAKKQIDDGEEETAEEPLFNITSQELFLLSFFSIDLRLIAGLSLIVSLIQPIELGIYRRLGFLIASATLITMILIALLIVLLWIIGVASTVARYYNFRLRKTGQSLEYERGLINRFTGSIPLEKVQTLTVKENPLMRYFGYSSLSVETAGYSPGQSQNQGSEVAVPLAEKDRVLDLAHKIETLEMQEFIKPPKRARRRYTMRYLIILALTTSFVGLLNYVSGLSLSWYVPIILVPITPLAAHLKWRNRGYFIGNRYVATRYGFWNRETKIVPYYRLQTISNSSTILQRRWGLSTVTIDTAGSYGLISKDAKAIDIDIDTAGGVIDDIYNKFVDSLNSRGTDTP